MKDMQKIEDAYGKLTDEDRQRIEVRSAKTIAESFLRNESIKILKSVQAQAQALTSVMAGPFGIGIPSQMPSPDVEFETNQQFDLIRQMIKLKCRVAEKMDRSCPGSESLKASEVMAQRRVHAFLEVCMGTMSLVK